MRQTGYLASCCLHALRNAEANLKLDHENAQKLARGISEGANGVVTVDVQNIQTNIVHVKIVPPSLSIQTFIERLKMVFYIFFCFFCKKVNGRNWNFALIRLQTRSLTR
jgi:threonine aldolase